jgi:hypothetical protein
MPANLKLLEGMLIEDRAAPLRMYAAEVSTAVLASLNGRPRTCRRLYRRCYDHALLALQQDGLSLDRHGRYAGVTRAIARLDKPAVPALFWTSCLGKWIDMNRDASPHGLGNAAALMERVLELAGLSTRRSNLFSACLGGRAPLWVVIAARQHFRRASEINGDRLLLVNLLKAECLYRQQLDRICLSPTLTPSSRPRIFTRSWR